MVCHGCGGKDFQNVKSESQFRGQVWSKRFSFHCPYFRGECDLFLDSFPADCGSESVSGIFVAMHHAVYLYLTIYMYIFVRLYTGIEREIPDSKFPKESYHSAWRFNSFLSLTFHHGSALLLRCFFKIFLSQLSNI